MYHRTASGGPDVHSLRALILCKYCFRPRAVEGQEFDHRAEGLVPRAARSSVQFSYVLQTALPVATRVCLPPSEPHRLPVSHGRSVSWRHPCHVYAPAPRRCHLPPLPGAPPIRTAGGSTAPLPLLPSRPPLGERQSPRRGRATITDGDGGRTETGSGLAPIATTTPASSALV